MKNDLYERFGWCKSWKALLIVLNLFSLGISAIHFFSKLGFDPDKTADGKLGILIIACHIWQIALYSVYSKNYKLLVENDIIPKTSNLFGIGVFCIVLWEIINILVLIFL